MSPNIPRTSLSIRCCPRNPAQQMMWNMHETLDEHLGVDLYSIIQVKDSDNATVETWLEGTEKASPAQQDVH